MMQLVLGQKIANYCKITMKLLNTVNSILNIQKYFSVLFQLKIVKNGKKMWLCRAAFSCSKHLGGPSDREKNC